MLADMVRTDSHQLRPAAGDSPEAEGIKVLARTHKTLIWERTREVQRLRHQLREYFPAALDAFADLDAPDTLALLAKAPDPDPTRKLTPAPPALPGGHPRRTYSATSPIPRASGKKKAVMARFVHNDRLVDALNAQAFASLNASPGARAYYDELRARGIEHNDALRRLANRLVGILHGCLKTRTLYDEATACSHRENLPQSSVAASHLSSSDVFCLDGLFGDLFAMAETKCLDH